MRIEDVPTGDVVGLTCLYRCVNCGCTVFNASFNGKATDEYSTGFDGRLRRKFLFTDNNFCGCEDWIWMADEYTPYTAPEVFVVESVEQR